MTDSHCLHLAYQKVRSLWDRAHLGLDPPHPDAIRHFACHNLFLCRHILVLPGLRRDYGSRPCTAPTLRPPALPKRQWVTSGLEHHRGRITPIPIVWRDNLDESLKLIAAPHHRIPTSGRGPARQAPTISLRGHRSLYRRVQLARDCPPRCSRTCAHSRSKGRTPLSYVGDEKPPRHAPADHAIADPE